MPTRTSNGRVASWEKLPTGAGIRVRLRVGRDGLYEYRMPDGSTRVEYRSPESLQATVSKLKDMPITVGHPASQLVKGDNWQATARGHISEIEPELEQGEDGHKWAIAWAAIHEPKAIQEVLNGKLVETSLGQIGDFGPAGQTADGKPYHASQEPGDPNHLALLYANQARAGRECRVLLDSLDESDFSMDEQLKDLLTRIGKLEAEAAQASAQIAQLTQERDTLQTRLDSVEKDLGTVTAERDQLKTRNDSLDTDKLVAEELEFRDSISAHLPKGYDFAKAGTRRQVRLDAIKHLGGEIADDASDELIAGYLQGAMKAAPPKSKEVRNDSKDPQEIRAARRLALVAGGK